MPLVMFTGPNAVYNAFRRTLFFARLQNRCLVIPHFYNHITQSRYPVKRQGEETFDIGRLRNVINTSTLDEYNTQCNENVTIPQVVIPPLTNTTHLVDKYHYKVQRFYRNYTFFKDNRMIQEFQQTTGIHLHNVSFTNHTEISWFKDSYDSKCVVYFPGIKSNFGDIEGYTDNEETALTRAPYVKRLADEAVTYLCDGRFAVVHWRNKSGEGCRPKLCNNNLRHELDNQLDNVGVIVKSIQSYLKSQKIDCLYVATPRYSKRIIESLNTMIAHLFSLQDLISMSENINEYQSDLYVLSLVEQELAELTVK
ncbi:uncharacterized protein LOC102803352 [Saccoglossus kowalevskii]|uniref:peptide-O-fucosyltransferase n=1 Tax=Saccoglossus kowalevskii TaxID=10224 RepID=A0ABM0MN53_SACKO|nr:PREDICTED: uncharacterized protein LOC102803352 [Saccoglossus kowalevskii]